MRVLHITGGTIYGGIETMLATLARRRALCPEIEAEFALCHPGRLGEELAAARAIVHPLGEPRLRRPLAIRRARSRLKELLRSGRFDAAICHAAWSHAVFARAVREAQVPLVCWLHDATDGRNFIERWARMTPPALVVCNSRFTARRTAAMFPDVATEVVHCPVPRPPGLTADIRDKMRSEIRAELSTPEAAGVIVMAARMQAWKGHRLLLEALGAIRDDSGRNPRWVCWIAGGVQRPAEAEWLVELKARAAALGISERVRFLGQRDDVARLLFAADIYCQPNLSPEPFGVAFVEALYAGLPVVTTAMGGALEIVDESCGVLTPPGDAPALASVLQRLVANPEERVRLCAAGPSRAAALCDPAAQIGRLRAILSRLDARKRPFFCDFAGHNA